ncbi:hypothetical protein A3742_00905 [Oleiphilus sp. HI0071]|nr:MULTISPECIES: bifunctional hydroxymethylpyrimidine kinase/phosphomethylpyrimidine kinase [unclassified Oleiphilus]KZY71079.1 hypothetical protein A3737_12070 [Oleiphilus sp. HI0065]KZY83012.1 hypothetical protein A3742_00905 [Oleiphilus sp. HI0071]KZY91750.1 hypothetical protein A3744_20170 [Oleiphilus sp. HI0073]KZZ40717.1 hypothetical protein A3758_08350 [Oleiphilus sp. HI0118]KZZ51849.1 hypothetical protein A3760_12025 [Oleiphilus sp. HI0122]KZZ66147.1 hypothetical protein A3765_05320 [
MSNTPICITIAGSDSSGGAGIQADLKTFAAHNCYAMSVITASTAQTHLGITDIQPLPSHHIKAQLDALLQNYSIKAIKTGMFSSSDQIETVADALDEYNHIPLIVDPVLGSSSGSSWVTEELVNSYLTTLLPRATLITPNTIEAETLFNVQKHAKPLGHLQGIAMQYNVAILLKGGHAVSSDEVIDHLVQPHHVESFHHRHIESENTHGTGCTLASAITANIAHGETLQHACALAIDYIDALLRSSKGFIEHNSKPPLRNLPMNHFFEV